MNTPSFVGIDVGTPKLCGTTRRKAAGLEIMAGGEDIWGERDEFHFAYVPVSENFEMCARLISLAMADLYTKALNFNHRMVKNSPCSGIYPPQPLPTRPDFPVIYPNVWLKLIRGGDTITDQSNENGQHWKTFCVHQQRLPLEAYLGLAVTSHHADQTVKAVFSDLNLINQP